MFLFAIWDGKAWISHAQPMENPKKIQNHPLLPPPPGTPRLAKILVLERLKITRLAQSLAL